MTEEEKEARNTLVNEIADILVGEYCKQCEICENEGIECYYGKAIDTIDALIEKQQKEIEQLANGIKVLGTNLDITTTEIIKEFTENPISEEYMKEFKSRYINKNEIRNLLPKINGSISHFKSKNDNHIVKRIKRMLEDLLEE